MARTAITVQAMAAHGGGKDDIAWTAADATNDHEFLNTGRELVLMKNDSAGALTATLVSVADEYGRTGDKTITTGASDISIFGPFPPSKFNQAGGLMHIDLTDDTSLSFAVVQFQNY